MRVEVVVLCGVPGAGKSTWCRAHADGYVIVSKDLMPNVRRKDARQARLIWEAVSAGRSVVVDNTNLTRVVRAPLIDLARALDARCRAIVFDVPLDVALSRNAARSGRARVPEGIVRQMAESWEVPTIEEGFVEVVTHLPPSTT